MAKANTVLLLLLLTLAGLPPVARAQDGIAWNELSDDQRDLLAPLEDDWERLPDERRPGI